MFDVKLGFEKSHTSDTAIVSLVNSFFFLMGPVPPFEGLTENEIGSADENVPEFLFFSICCDDVVFVPIEVSLLVSLGPCVKHCHHFLRCLLMGIKSLLEFGFVLHFDLPKSEIKLEPRRLSM